MSIKDKWVEDRAEEIRSLPSTVLVNLAGDKGVKFADHTTRRALARRIAEAEWENREGDSLAEQLASAGFYVENDKYKGQNLDAAAFGGDEFNAMESGPMEEENPAVTRLRQEIMERWIGAIGGMDWYNGPNGEREAQPYGKALAAVLDDVLHGGVVRGSNPYNIQTSSGWFIYEVVLPQVLRHFFQDNADYGDNHREGLGVRAEFVGVHRKVKKLEKAIWLGEDMTGEGAEEMLTDLIGQCLIMLDLLAQPS